MILTEFLESGSLDNFLKVRFMTSMFIISATLLFLFFFFLKLLQTSIAVIKYVASLFVHRVAMAKLPLFSCWEWLEAWQMEWSIFQR